MKPFYLIALLASLWCLNGCNKIKNLEYKGIKNTRVKQAGFGNTDITLDAIFYNPNKFGVQVKEADLDIYIDNVQMGKADIFLDKSTLRTIEIPREKQFVIPIIAHIEPMKAISTLLKALSSSAVKLDIRGTTKVGKGGVFIKVPIEVNESVNLKDLK
jgi:LEA14-like dessication related protein